MWLWFLNVRAHQFRDKYTSLCAKNLIFCSTYGSTVEVLVLIDFEGTMADELTVKAGDVVKNVTKANEEGWLEGELAGKRGIVPANFVKVVNTIQSMTVNRDCALCLYVFTSVKIYPVLRYYYRRCQSI